jgi:hypothetical protein
MPACVPHAQHGLEDSAACRLLLQTEPISQQLACCCWGQELEDTFYVVDLGMLHRLHAFFVAAMPRVTPFYAMKCMPDKVRAGANNCAIVFS